MASGGQSRHGGGGNRGQAAAPTPQRRKVSALRPLCAYSATKRLQMRPRAAREKCTIRSAGILQDFSQGLCGAEGGEPCSGERKGQEWAARAEQQGARRSRSRSGLLLPSSGAAGRGTEPAGTRTLSSTVDGTRDIALPAGALWTPDLVDVALEGFFLPIKRTRSSLRWAKPWMVVANMLAVEKGGWENVEEELGGMWYRIAAANTGMQDLDMVEPFPIGHTVPADKLEELRRGVGETPVFDLAERGKVLRIMVEQAAARAGGMYPGHMAMCVAGARGTGKSKVLLSLLGGIHWTFNSGPRCLADSKETKPMLAVYTGYLERPLWIVPDPACGDDIFKLPPVDVTNSYVDGALPMPLVQVAIEILRAQGVDVPGSFRELPGARPGTERLFCWSEKMLWPEAYGALRDWLKAQKLSVVMVLDEWQDNFLERVPEFRREQLIGQLTWESKFREPRGNTPIFTVFAGSSLDVVPAITRTGEVRAGDLSLKRSNGSNIVIPPKRMGCHPHRVSVAHFWPFQSIEQVLQFMGSSEFREGKIFETADEDAVREVSTEMPSYLQRIAAAQGQARVELLLTESVPGAQLPLPDLIEETGGNPRLIQGRCLNVGGDAPDLLLNLDLVSNAKVASVYWALLWAMKRSLRSWDDHRVPGPTQLSMRSRMVSMTELQIAMGLLHEFAEDHLPQAVTNTILLPESLTEDLVRDWASDGKFVVSFEGGAMNMVGFPTAAHYRAAVRLAATYELSLHPRYAMAVMNPAGKLAREEGEYLLSATLARRLKGGRTVAGKLVAEQGAVSSSVRVGVIRALLEEEILSGLPEDRAHAKAFARAMWRLDKVGKVGIDQSAAGVGGQVASIDALDKAERRALAKEGYNDDASFAELTAKEARQRVLKTAVACALGDFPSAWTASTSAYPLSEPAKPLRWDPKKDAMEPGMLYLRDGQDKGIDAAGITFLTRSITLSIGECDKVRGEDSQTKMEASDMGKIALKAHYDMTAGGAGAKVPPGVKYMIPVLFVMTNWLEASTMKKDMTDSSVAELFRPGEALDWKTSPTRLVKPLDGKTSIVQATLLAQFGNRHGRATVRSPLVAEGRVRFKPSLIPYGGIAVATTKSVLAPLWPVEVRAFAQEHGLTFFGAMADNKALKQDLLEEGEKRVAMSVWSRKSRADLEREKRKAEEEAAEQKRKAEEEAAEQKRKAEEEAAEQKRKAEEEAAEQKRKAEEEMKMRLEKAMARAGISRERLESVNLPITYDVLVSPASAWTQWLSAVSTQADAIGGKALLQLARDLELNELKAGNAK